MTAVRAEQKFGEGAGAAALRYLEADIPGATALPQTEVASASVHHGNELAKSTRSRRRQSLDRVTGPLRHKALRGCKPGLNPF
jgi:hypothetical protein